MPIVAFANTFAQKWSEEVSKDYFGTVVKSGINATGGYGKTAATRNGTLLEGINNTTLSLESLNMGSIRYPGGTEARYFSIGDAEDIAGLHRAIDYCAQNGLRLNFTLNDTRYIKDLSTQTAFLTEPERAELTQFIQNDLIGYAMSKGVGIESIHIGNEFQGRADAYGAQPWVGYAKVSAVLINELDQILDADPSLQLIRPDIVIQPINWDSASQQDRFVRLLASEIGIDGQTAAAKVDAIDVHGVGTGNGTVTNTLELTWEEYFGTGEARPYEENIARMVRSWRDDPRVGDIDFRNDAWAYADTPNLKDAALGMLQMHTASELGFESVTNYIGYGRDASALLHQPRDQNSDTVEFTAGGALFEMMSRALLGTKAVSQSTELPPQAEARLPILTRVFEGDGRIVLYLVNRTGEAMDIDLVTSALTTGNDDFSRGVVTANISILGSDNPLDGRATPRTRILDIDPQQLEVGLTDFSLAGYEIAQVTLIAADRTAPPPSVLPVQAAPEDIIFGVLAPDVIQIDGESSAFLSSNSADTLIGTAEVNTVSYQTAHSGVAVHLAKPVANTGDAAGDSFSKIRNVIGSEWNDTLTGDQFANSLFGGDGNDVFQETGGGDKFFGGNGARDLLILDQRSTVLSLRTGSNSKGMTVSDIEDVMGGAGSDTITGSQVDNNLSGRTGADILTGLDGDDTLEGNGGRDKLYGGNGDDRLIGGAGRDTLFGGDGRDTFLYFTPKEGGDVIADFNAHSETGDMLSFRAKSFGNLAAGQLDTSHFVSRKEDNRAQDVDDRFIYREADQSLWFDMDGSGKLPPSLLAKLDGEDEEEETTFSASLIWLF